MNDNRLYISIFFCFIFSYISFSQSSFEFVDIKHKDKIRFKLVNNLIIVPVSVNGIELSFLLDTGVKETLVFNMRKIDSLTLNKARVLRVKGVNNEVVEAVKSVDNTLKIGNLESRDHVVYALLNQNSNLSSYLGTEIHGILGYHFFKDFVLEISYTSQLIKVFPKGTFKTKWGRYKEVSLTFHKEKPYIVAKVNGEIEKLLMDTGMSDGLWMFKEDDKSIKKYGFYEDFLGMTISGEILGKRSKVNQFEFGGETFRDVKIAYPYPEGLPKEIKYIKERSGSLGGELLGRFNFVVDYGGKAMYLKKNRRINDPFYYNKSGIVLRQDIEAVEKNKNNPLFKSLQENDFISFIDLSYVLSPEYVIDHVRKDSPAALAGVLKGDVLLEINGAKTYRFSLKEINAMFYDKNDKLLRLKLKRSQQVFEREIYLKSPLTKTL